MPKHNSMISRAVDLVARKLAGMDKETISRLTLALSEEAQMIAEELQYSGEPVNSDILAAKLDGLVARMKYEVRNQGPDPSPHEFPIFNVSHNPMAPYPNPINHLYDKRYKEAYSTFIRQNQPPAQKTEPSTPPSPAPPQPKPNPNPSSYPTYSQGQQSNASAPPSPASSQPKANPNSSSYPTYSQGQQSNTSAPPPPGFLPAFREQPANGWPQMNPYATMPRSHAAYYQQQASNLMPTIQEQSSTNSTQRLRHSSTGDDLRSHSLSHSASSNELNYPTNPSREKIRVRVITDKSASTDPQVYTYPNNRFNTQRSILKSNNNGDDNGEMATTRTIYTSPNTDVSEETIEDLFKVVSRQQSEPSATSPKAERIFIIDRRGSSTPDTNLNPSGTDRVRTFEVRSSRTGAAPSPAPAAATSNLTTSPSSAVYTSQQPNYYSNQQLFYQQPKIYASAPNMMYPTATPWAGSANSFYPFGFFPY